MPMDAAEQGLPVSLALAGDMGRGKIAQPRLKKHLFAEKANIGTEAVGSAYIIK